MGLGLERYAPYKEYLHSEEGFGIAREVPRCISACPAGCDIQGYIKLIAEGMYEDAYSLIKETIPFPASIGRICHHPCEDNCKRGFFDEPITIAYLKRFVGDYTLEKGRKGELLIEKRGAKAKKVAIIGAGPAGLTAAYRLVEKRYTVKIFDKLPVLGGMLFVGIPPYRLPKDVLTREIDAVKGAGKGIEIETGVEIDKEEFKQLRREYDAIFIAVGAHVSRKLEVDGEDLEGVVHGVDFLRDFNLEHGNGNHDNEKAEKIGKKVAVVGGGNVAIDVARCAIRQGSDVTIVYRRSREEMPARRDEIKEAEEEGVKFMFLVNPTRILGSEKVEKMELIQMELGPPDESGRRRPVPIEGSEFLIDMDTVIPAIGQASDLRFLEGSGVETLRGLAIKADEFGITTEEGVFAGGDCVRGAAFAVDAIADGNEAAESIDRFLRGVNFREGRTAVKIPEERLEEVEYIKEELEEEEERGIISKKRRKETARIGIEERIESFEEIKLGFSAHAAVDETERCFKCRSCILAFPTATVETEEEREEIDTGDFINKLTYATGVNKCAECGMCTASCPVTAIEPGFSPRRLSGKALMEDAEKLALSEEIWMCTTCGICNAICPYGVDFLSFIQGVRKVASSKNFVPHFFEAGLLATEEIGADASDSDRLRWLEGEGGEEELKVADTGEVYYFAGCLSSLDRVYSDRVNLRLLEIARSAVKILNSIGIVPAVGKEEKCCGHDLLWRGDEKRFKELMEANIEVIKRSGAKTLVFTCAECLRTFEVDYRRFSPDLEFEVMHISEFLKDKELKFIEGKEQIITYHDPCRLRHLNNYDSPRKVLKRIPGVELKEMMHTRERATCCGVSALVTCGPVAREMQIERLAEAEQTGASKLIVACPKCWIHLDCASASNPELGRGSKDKIQIEDLTMMVASRLDLNHKLS